VAGTVPGLITDAGRLAAMGTAAASVVPRDADVKLATMVVESAR
jgi:UDP-N-acetylglucosamine--N-acetylmuramyl-(pentapeptide) pyrophosphoryl-undecaprenol N-acetylglucosamine transferase